MRRFLILLKDIDLAKEEFQNRTQKAIRDLLYCRITGSKQDFQDALSEIYPRVSLDISTARIMNVKVPVIEVKEINIDKGYDFFKTSAQLDVVVYEAQDYIRSLLKLAQLLKTLDILSCEIERTRRRVNALEYLLIPSIQDAIRYITQKLNEFERGNLVRLMRVKEIVRSH
jgi:V/A-type H+-transporting ATPase subunit D